MMDMKKTKPFYGKEAWKKCRAAVLARDQGMCRDCMERFDAGYGSKPNRATMVHHIISYEERPDLALEMSNLISLCDRCHALRHPEKGTQSHADPDKPTFNMRVIKV